MKREDHVKLLKKYYQDQKISIENFCCKHKKECHVDGCDVGRGSEAYIGEKYGAPFKVLVASLDRGKDALTMEDRLKEITKGCIENESRNPHMRGTLKTLEAIFSKDKAEEGSKLFKHFAMINTAKCSLNKNMKQAPWRFFKNCRDHTRAEVEILNPNVIIAQGRKAADVFESLYPPTESKNEVKWFERRGEITLDNKCNKKALLICSVHPSARGKGKKKWESFVKNELPEIIENRDLKN